MSLELYGDLSPCGSEDMNEEKELETKTDVTTLSANRKMCPHCSNFLSIKTFRKHKQLYYNKVSFISLLAIQLYITVRS